MTEEHKRKIAEGHKKHCMTCNDYIDRPIRNTGQWVHSGLCNYIATYLGAFQQGKLVLSGKTMRKLDLIHKKYIRHG